LGVLHCLALQYGSFVARFIAIAKNAMARDDSPRSFDCQEQQSQDDKPSFLYSALVSARDAHIFPVLRDRSASDLDALRLQKAGDLLVRQRPGRIFFFDKLFHPALEDEQRSVASLRTVDAFAEKVP
jgi:hypothetical protein